MTYTIYNGMENNLFHIDCGFVPYLDDAYKNKSLFYALFILGFMNDVQKRSLLTMSTNGIHKCSNDCSLVENKRADRQPLVVK